MSSHGLFPLIEFRHFDWLRRSGVDAAVITSLMPIGLAHGAVGVDGRFDEDAEAQGFLVFQQEEDTIFWCPRSGQIGTWEGSAFALGEAAILDPATYAFDGNLNLYADPLEWLRKGCDGCVVLNWARAFEELRDCPRIAIAESLLFLWRRHMRPARMPELFVLASSGKAVAA